MFTAEGCRGADTRWLSVAPVAAPVRHPVDAHAREALARASVRDRIHDDGRRMRAFRRADDHDMGMTTKKKPACALPACALATLLIAGVTGVGCQLEKLFPEMVGEGAARLTVANTGAILRLANSDP